MDPRIPEEPGSPSLLRPRTVGEILGDAFRLYARHWQNLIVIVAAIVIPLSFLQVLFGNVLIGEGLAEEEFRNGVEVSAVDDPVVVLPHPLLGRFGHLPAPSVVSGSLRLRGLAR